MENFIYSNPVRFLFGKGQLEQLGKEILPYGRKILLVYGKNHLKATGGYERITRLLKESDIMWYDLEGVHSNPRLDLVHRGIEICRTNKIDFILAVGGGSASDTAKAVAMGVQVKYDIWNAYEDFHNLMHGNQLEINHIPTRALPFGVVMTKAGTGSEFDYTSVLSNHTTLEKLMVIDKNILYARFAIDDPELSYSLPGEQTAYGIADIMTHFLEQYFTLSSHTDALDQYIEAGIRTVISAGSKVLANGRDYQARSTLLYNAAWACSDKTMSGAAGGWAAHMIEHELTALTDLNHGHGMAIVFLGWMNAMAEHLPAKFARYACNVWGIAQNEMSDLELARLGIEKTKEYWQSLGISLTLKQVNIDRSTISKAAKQAVRFGTLNSIVPLQEEDCYRILESVLE